MTQPRSGDDPEAVIRQAMRAMAGGRRDEQAGAGGSGPADGSRRGPRWTTVQIVLLAAIIGLVLGMAGAFAVLLTR